VNVVFDLGGVVVAYDLAALLDDLYADSPTHQAVRTALIEHRDWISLDRGTLSEADAVERAAARSGVAAAEFARFLERMSVAWTPVPGTVELLHRLRADGHALFCLSNMHPASLAFLERTFDFWPLFTGVVISCRVGLCKPEPSIFQHVLERHALVPSETVFVDDVDVNLSAARALGIRTVKFETPAQCASALRRLGIDVARDAVD
jgi:putative hydrolase of the HAD superfamily